MDKTLLFLIRIIDEKYCYIENRSFKNRTYRAEFAFKNLKRHRKIKFKLLSKKRIDSYIKDRSSIISICKKIIEQKLCFLKAKLLRFKKVFCYKISL